MKISIKPENGPRLVFFMPLALISNPLSRKLIFKYVNIEGLSKEHLKMIFQELRRVRKLHKGLELIHVETNDNVHVSIKL